VRPGRHAADDNSFGRSAGGAAARGAGLLALAMILGIVLLQSADEGEPFEQRLVVGEPVQETTTTRPPTTSTTTPLRRPADVKVLTANGTDVKGLGGTVANTLKEAGYNVLAPTDASERVKATVVYFSTGYEAEARAVARLIKAPDDAVHPAPSPVPVEDQREFNVLVVAGPDQARAGATTTTSGRSTTTTSGRTSTTARRTTTTGG